MASASRLLSLPVELQRSILDYIKSCADLKALSLVCYASFDLATPKLYRDINFSISVVDATLGRSLNRSNRSLRHTRNLTIYDDETDYDHEKHGGYVADLIQSFPRDSLEFIELDTMSPVPRALTLLLHMRHRGLRNLVCHQQQHPASLPPYLQADDLRNITTIALYIESERDCYHGGLMLNEAPQLRDLVIYKSGSLRNPLQHVFHEWVDETSSKPRLVLRRLFLGFVYCGNVGQLLSRAVDFTALRDFELYWCSFTGNFLDYLSTQRLNLVRFVTNVNGDSEATLAKFLGTLNDLKHFRFSRDPAFEEVDECHWNGIIKHGPSLRLLYVDDTGLQSVRHGVNEGDRNMQAFRKLCATCPNLEQLGLQAPPFPWDHDAIKTCGFEVFLDCLKSLKNLVSLRLITYPLCLNEEEGKDALEREADLLMQMQRTSDLVFSSLRQSCRRLTAILVEARTEKQSYKSFEAIRKFAYLRELYEGPSSTMDVRGRSINHLLLPSEEPYNEIFHHRA